jgi:hypothetical protein
MSQLTDLLNRARLLRRECELLADHGQYARLHTRDTYYEARALAGRALALESSIRLSAQAEASTGSAEGRGYKS